MDGTGLEAFFAIADDVCAVTEGRTGVFKNFIGGLSLSGRTFGCGIILCVDVVAAVTYSCKVIASSSERDAPTHPLVISSIQTLELLLNTQQCVCSRLPLMWEGASSSSTRSGSKFHPRHSHSTLEGVGLHHLTNAEQTSRYKARHEIDSKMLPRKYA